MAAPDFLDGAAGRTWFGALQRPGAEARRAALLEFCAASLDMASGRLALDFSDFGAPLLLIDGALGKWRISSASRENICLFGLAGQNIGVDLEILDAPQEPAWNVLHPHEQAALRALSPGESHAAFLQLWTAKEAYLKALGLGLRREPSEILVRRQEAGFQIFDRGVETPMRLTRAWREQIGTRKALCACVILADGSAR